MKQSPQSQIAWLNTSCLQVQSNNKNYDNWIDWSCDSPGYVCKCFSLLQSSFPIDLTILSWVVWQARLSSLMLTLKASLSLTSIYPYSPTALPHATLTSFVWLQVFEPIGSWPQVNMKFSVPVHWTFEEWTGCTLARLLEAEKLTTLSPVNPSWEQATAVSKESHPSLQMLPHCMS